jgi:hypothetical protein
MKLKCSLAPWLGWLAARENMAIYCIKTSAAECLFVLVAPIEEALSQCSKMSFLASYRKQGRRRRHCMCALRANTPLRRQQVSAQCSSHGAHRGMRIIIREKKSTRDPRKKEKIHCIFELHISFLSVGGGDRGFCSRAPRHSYVIDS